MHNFSPVGLFLLLFIFVHLLVLIKALSFMPQLWLRLIHPPIQPGDPDNGGVPFLLWGCIFLFWARFFGPALVVCSLTPIWDAFASDQCLFCMSSFIHPAVPTLMMTFFIRLMCGHLW